MANNISQLSTANTFEQWLIATQGLIATANLLSAGNGQTFYANTILEVGGTGAQLNVRTTAGINELYANTANLGEVVITGNIATLNVTTQANIGGNVIISGDLTVTGNLTLDTVGFNDLNVAGNGTFGGTLFVTNDTTLSNVIVTGNVSTLNVTNTIEVGGSANVNGAVYIAGDLTVGGNLTLDAIGFDDLSVSGNGSFGGTLTVTGDTTLNTTSIEVITGNAVNQFDASGSAIALSIALG
jgi:cytoskeletal protein CcmA (bactofilin family)